MSTDTPSTEAFLRDYHRHHPGITARVFARGRTDDGLSSYDLLAALVPDGDVGRARVLDLGCGDGYLLERLLARGLSPDRIAGADMSPEELSLARRRVPGVRLLCERAQTLSLAADSFDYVLSHLAFMLMSEIDTVVEQLARILVPGGLFATVVGGGPRLGDAFERFVDLLNEFFRDRPGRPPPIGDRRAYSDQGLAELFAPASGFEPPTIRDAGLHLDGPFEAVWASLSSVYDLHGVSARDRDEFRERFAARVSDITTDDGMVKCTMFVRLVTCRRC